MTRASVVIIGGGVIGASVAWHLAQLGWREILILDQGEGPGEGSTGRATGGFRASYGSAINVRLSLLAREKFRRFADDTGGVCGFQPVGYLWLASSGAELDELRAGLELQHGEGLGEACEVSADQCRALVPALAAGTVTGGVWSPTDGYIRPLGILSGYLAAAERHGVTARWGTRVEGLERDSTGRILAVHTNAGPIQADHVVNAAGAWAGRVAATAGLEVPVTPLRRQIVPTAPTSVLPPGTPMTLFAGDGFHFRVRDDHVLLAWPTPGAADDPWSCTVEPGWVEQVTAMAHQRVPALREVPVLADAAWGGLYEISPDKHAVLGVHPECENFFLANGSSGHGVMHAPALGALLAEIMTHGEARALDARPLRPSRFAENDSIPGSALL
ncbi:MAG TPA: FAD-dependent oxidoreductase [Gemmatimonadales bacterium]|nr:FAD-dependent oxidoreductase [Gemmatimonadales bacterium]